jgi:hypothetical protein
MSAQQLGRPPTMMDFIRALQSVEQELRFPQTPVVVPEQVQIDLGPLRQNEDPTRMKAPVVIAAAAAAQAPGPAEAEELDEAEAKPRWGVAVLGLVVVALIIGIGIWLGSSSPSQVPDTPTTATVAPQIGEASYNPLPTNLQVEGEESDGQVALSWTYQNARSDDTYLVSVNGGAWEEVPDKSMVLESQPDMCVLVKVHRADGTAADMTPKGWPSGCGGT